MGRISDNLGNKYEIILSDDENAPVLNLMLKSNGFVEMPVGYARFFVSGDVLRLQDLRIFDKATFYRRSRWSSLLGCRRVEKNFQRLGLGTQLLGAVFEFAKARYFKTVFGQIVRRDLEENPNLPKWYSKHGFAVTETKNGFDIVAQVSPD